MDFKTFKKDVDKFRIKVYPRKVVLTKDQIDFIVLCRNHENPISIRKMVELWIELGWGNMTKTTMKDRVDRIKNMGLLK